MKQTFITIPEPCHENWNEMTPAEKGRYCASCEKIVVDFTSMTDREILRYFEKYKGNTCGRFDQQQLNHALVPEKKTYPWMRYFLSVTLPAWLVAFKAQAQQKTAKVETPMEVVQLTGVVMTSHPKAIKLSGRVLDENGEPIASASITSRLSSCKTDNEGYFSMKLQKNEGLSSLHISAVGYYAVDTLPDTGKEMDIVLKTRAAVMDTVKVESGTNLKGRVMMAGGISSISYVKTTNIPVIGKLIDSFQSKMKIFPNPAPRNSSVTLQCNKIETGDYILSLIRAGGEIISNREVRVNSKQQTLPLPVPGTGGTYYINLFNRKTAKSYTEKLVVQ